jgi:hypothetical protein
MDNNINLLVIGYGGSGQTFFMRHIKNNFGFCINNLTDKDKLKHISFPNNNFDNIINNNANIKIIFVINDCFNSVCSHFRRNWPQIQINKLQNIHNISLINNNINTIEEYLKHVENTNIDYFGFLEQVKSWTNYNGSIYFHNFDNPNYISLLNFLELSNTEQNINKIKYEVKTNDKYDSLKKKYNNSHKFYEDINNKINNIINKSNNY